MSLSEFYVSFFSSFLSAEEPKKPFFTSIAVYVNSLASFKKYYLGLASSLSPSIYIISF